MWTEEYFRQRKQRVGRPGGEEELDTWAGLKETAVAGAQEGREKARSGGAAQEAGSQCPVGMLTTEFPPQFTEKLWRVLLNAGYRVEARL